MAADDALPSWTQPELDGATGARTQQAVAQLSRMLEEVEQRLNTPVGSARSDEDLLTLIEALQVLALRVPEIEGVAAGRYGTLGAALDVLVDRLERQVALKDLSAERDCEIVARLDRLNEDRAPVAPQSWSIRAVLALAGAAALGVATVLAVGLPPRPDPIVSANVGGLADLPLRPGLKAEPQPMEASLRIPNAVALTPPASPRARETHEVVAAALARGEATALARLIGLAQAGDPKAQLHLARLYETGQAGLARDMVAAGIWTRRAAEAGERVAMHNLGLFLMQGEGGQRDVAEAAIWFRRAADQGVVDSQYNLGLLYQAGQGVDRNLREAYRWFTVAANAGDGLSREKAVALEAVIKAGERAGLAREAAAFQPGAATPADPVILIPPATTLAETQALLSRQGYYLGPIDGAPNPNLEAATAAYARDHPAQGAASRP